MSQNPKDLIQQLSSGLKPVAPLRISSAFWIMAAVSLLSTVLGAMILGFRHDVLEHVLQVGVEMEILGLLGIVLPLIYVIFKKSIPGRDVSPFAYWVLALGILTEGAGIFTGLRLGNWSEHVEAGIQHSGLSCSLTVLAFAFLPSLVVTILLRKFAPVHPKQIAGVGFLVAAVSGAFAILFHCPANEPLHDLVWHLGPILPAFLIGSFVGSRFLKW